ncbi:C2 domain-containing protein [Blastocladiella britannica]|nr:C2 domain-containing protein [Blastocladiella britannica]
MLQAIFGGHKHEEQAAPAATPAAAPAVPVKPKRMVHIDRVEVILYAAKGLRDTDGIVSGNSDPYVVVKCGAHKKQSKTIKGTLNPKWDETITIDAEGLLGGDSIVLELFDEDIGTDDNLGHAAVPLEELRSGNRKEGWFKLEGKKAKGEIHVAIIPYGRME